MNRENLRLKKIALYFLKLGAVGFGGSVALAQTMHKDLVDKRKWLTHEEYLRGLTLSGLTPGPLSAQLAIYMGYVFAGVSGATVAGISFILPSFVLVLVVSMFYFRFGNIPQIQFALYGIGAAVIGILVASAYKLTSQTMKPRPVLWIIFAAAFIFTVFVRETSLLLFVLGGLLNMGVSKDKVKIPVKLNGILISGSPMIPLFFNPLEKLFSFFLQAGALAFGGGLAIIPFLHTGVKEFGWLTNRQFLDAIAIAMITPGPVAISATFIGFAVKGILGATIATVAIFLPVYLLVIILTPFFIKHSGDINLTHFVEGVTAASMGAIVGSIINLSQQSLVSPITALLAISALILYGFFEMPGIVIVFASGIIGILFH